MNYKCDLTRTHIHMYTHTDIPMETIIDYQFTGLRTRVRFMQINLDAII